MHGQILDSSCSPEWAIVIACAFVRALRPGKPDITSQLRQEVHGASERKLQPQCQHMLDARSEVKSQMQTHTGHAA